MCVSVYLCVRAHVCSTEGTNGNSFMSPYHEIVLVHPGDVFKFICSPGETELHAESALQMQP
jgi:hypothetical protein